MTTNQDKAERFIGQVLKDVGVVFLERLVFISDQLGLCNVFHWLQDEAQRNAALRELNLLDDHCLDDIGIKRPFDPKTDDLVTRLRAGG
jgi:Domain of unknown function (DUF1127)